MPLSVGFLLENLSTYHYSITVLTLVMNIYPKTFKIHALLHDFGGYIHTAKYKFWGEIIDKEFINSKQFLHGSSA